MISSSGSSRVSTRQARVVCRVHCVGSIKEGGKGGSSGSSGCGSWGGDGSRELGRGLESEEEKARAAERAKADAEEAEHLEGALDAFKRALDVAPGAAVTLAARAAVCEAAGK
mmetsp:Transcript_6064/g.15457  ORF Transcript_6064/g.15457 Transcript_6064/m.15457 type:complete len:113 (+) Transcript_6064:527-865(+)